MTERFLVDVKCGAYRTALGGGGCCDSVAWRAALVCASRIPYCMQIHASPMPRWQASSLY